MEKITKRQKYGMLLEIAEIQANETLVEFINHEIELLDKKNGSKSDKPSKAQLENIELSNSVYDYMCANADKSFTATDIYKAVNLKSNQKATAILKMLKSEDKITRYEEKGVAYFTIVK